MGLEPTTSAVTGQHSNQLNYRTSFAGAAKVILYVILQNIFSLMNKKIYFLRHIQAFESYAMSAAPFRMIKSLFENY